ncbi:MAG TPA: hypothetical protein VEB66_16630 [Opitutaceae bacterium]|nr:hypothetical protein [Opitutaceae bacterium]
MSYTYLVTVVGLDPAVAAVTTADHKEELGHLEVDKVFALIERLQSVDPAAARKVDAGIIVRRGDKGWRVNAHHGQFRVYHSTSSLDNYWTAADVKTMGELPPFRAAVTEQLASKRGVRLGGGRPGGLLRTVGEIGGLVAVAVVLMGVAVYFGTPRRKLSDAPAGFQPASTAESQEVFARIAGIYTTSSKPGANVVMINPDGRVIFSLIGKDGRPVSPPKTEEQARAGRIGNAPALHTSYGLITLENQQAVKVGAYEWKRAAPL